MIGAYCKRRSLGLAAVTNSIEDVDKIQYRLCDFQDVFDIVVDDDETENYFHVQGIEVLLFSRAMIVGGRLEHRFLANDLDRPHVSPDLYPLM